MLRCIGLFLLFVVCCCEFCTVQQICDSLQGVYAAIWNTTTVILPSNISDSNSTCCISVRSKGIVCANSNHSKNVLTWNGEYTGLNDAISIKVSPGNFVERVFSNRSATQRLFVYDSYEERNDYIHITYPQYGALMSKRLEVVFSVHNSTPFDRIHFVGHGFYEVFFPADTIYLDSPIRERDIGSWFFEISTAGWATEPMPGNVRYQQFGHAAQGYVEFVRSDEEIRNSRFFSASIACQNGRDGEAAACTSSAQDTVQFSTTASTASSNATGEYGSDVSSGGDNIISPMNICLFNGVTLDGQKQIWRQQSLHMDPARFRFVWLLAESEAEDPTVHYIADLKEVVRGTNPNLVVTVAELREAPDDGSPAVAASWAGNSTHLFLYAHERLVAAEFRIEDVSPAWCKRFYEVMRNAMVGHGCQVVVYGNTQGFSSDVVVTDTARVLGLPTVAELLNLHLHPLVLPDVVVAPSHYALQHESVHNVIQVSGIRGVVIPPSVDSQLFSRHAVHADKVYRHPACSPVLQLPVRPQNVSAHWPCVVIGFVARLSPEKSPGLFLQTAYELLQRQPFARFAVVGDGVLRASLESLAARLGISWAVHFTGWVSAEQLPAVLAGMDIVVNPGLVLETFCIANMEAMSMEVPLVTFAVGGVGEYVAPPDPGADQDGGVEGQRLFSVTANAVVVHRAAPAALAEAVEHLILHPQLRRDLGQAARRTVVEHFNFERQMLAYSALYDGLRTARK